MIEFFQNNLWIMWMVVAGAFLLIEALTTALVSIWFVPSAIICAILSIWVDNFFIQIVVFIIVSAITMVICKKYFKFTKGEKLEETTTLLIGKTGIAKTDITDLEGKVLIGDVYWRAVSDERINTGEQITVVAVTGNILTVTKK